MTDWRPGTVVSHYEILEALGRGGMGTVYKARDDRLGRKVALKFLSDELSRDPAAVERFEREARTASGLNHPHVCAVYDVGEVEGRHYIVMELLEGAPLSQRVSGGPLPYDQVLELGIQIAGALGAAHERGLVHRDVKPANIFVTGGGTAKLLDFGVAKPLPQPDDATALGVTGRGEVVGTVAYMSPEQVRGDPLDARSDLFSLGAVLYEMAAGRRAFPGPTAGAVHDAILNRPPVPLQEVHPELPARFAGVVAKALERDRARRYQSAAELRADLQRLRRQMDREEDGASTTGSAGRSAGPRQRRRLSIAGAALLLVAAAAMFRSFSTRGDAIESLAVLPFVNVSGSPETDYLGDGLTESLIRTLSELPSVRVSAASRVLRYKGKEGDAQAIGRELGVRAVLSGRLLQRDESLVVRTELMDVADGSQLWGGEYSTTGAGMLEVQESLSREIAERLRWRLTSAERRRLTRPDTRNDEAYRSYLQGLYHWNRRTPAGNALAIEHLTDAVSRDPGFARAYAALADAYGQASFFNRVRSRDVMPRAKEAATRALEIDGELAEARISLGYVSFVYDWDWPAATRHFERAHRLNAAVVEGHPFYFLYLTVGGRSGEAVRLAAQAFDRDPVSASVSHSVAVQLLLARRHDEAIAACRRTLELDANFALAYQVMAQAMAASKSYREALTAAERAFALDPTNDLTLGLLGFVHGRLGSRAQALRIVQQLEAAPPEQYRPALAVAVTYAGLGDAEQAFRWLDRAYEERSNRLAYLRFEPVWEGLRPDPRYTALLERIGLPR